MDMVYWYTITFIDVAHFQWQMYQCYEKLEEEK